MPRSPPNSGRKWTFLDRVRSTTRTSSTAKTMLSTLPPMGLRTSRFTIGRGTSCTHRRQPRPTRQSPQRRARMHHVTEKRRPTHRAIPREVLCMRRVRLPNLGMLHPRPFREATPTLLHGSPPCECMTKNVEQSKSVSAWEHADVSSRL